MSRRWSHSSQAYSPVSDQHVDDQARAGRSEPRSIRCSKFAANHTNANLPSSFSQKTPARSFVHHASVSDSDGPQFSSSGVRQHTAEIASWALASSPSSNSHNSNNEDHERNGASTDALSGARKAKDVARPAAIEEISEPVTPEERPSEIQRARSNQHSDLTDMLHSSAQRLSTHLSQPSQTQASRPRHSSILFNDADESTPLLSEGAQDKKDRQPEGHLAVKDVESQNKSGRKPNTLQRLVHHGKQRCLALGGVLTRPESWSARAVWQHGIKQPAGLIPCVFLGVLLNVLDALSYGMILFPLGEPIFEKTGVDGIAMFYVSCIVSQLVFSCGGSVFKGGVGSEMIEVVPFFHKMTYTILATTGTEQPNVVLATVITAYALSSILTGFVFATLGIFKAGQLVNFFPRHILIGCIGGVGFFLFLTGIEVSARLDGNLEFTLGTARQLVRQDTILLWVIPLLLSNVLLVIKHLKQSPYIVPAFFISVAAVFYIVVTATSSLNLTNMRSKGWVFAEVKAGVPWYHFYSYYDFAIVNWTAVAKTVPAMFALTFFGILHVPINVPALAIAAEEDDLNLNRELVAHGVSNALSGFCGSIQNYLVYVNSEMFISNGGNTRVAGLMLAAATFGVLVAGPEMIGYVPIMVVGALIFYLGIELLLEALWETLGKMNKLEYLTVLAIVLTMGIYDFVGGILVGIVLACLNFVVQTSGKDAIRTTYSGKIVESTVRRHLVQRHYLHEVGYQIHVHKLAGMLFFGSIVQVEKQSRALIEDEAFRKEPIRYLIFDFAHVSGIDYSAAEAFTRMERVLGRRDVKMIISGVNRGDDVGKGLSSVGLWADESSVEFFECLNLALESCENKLLTTFYQQRDAVAGAEEHNKTLDLQSNTNLDVPKHEADSNDDILSAALNNNLSASPRQHLLMTAATSTLSSHPRTAHGPPSSDRFQQQSQTQPDSQAPLLPLLLHTFQPLSAQTDDFWAKAVQYFTRASYKPGTVLFRKGDRAEEFLLLECGMLRASYVLPVGTYHERIVAGTTCGELPFFSGTDRTATVSVEGPTSPFSARGRDQRSEEEQEESSDENEDRDNAIVWQLTSRSWAKMRKEWPQGAEELLCVALRLTKERVDAVTGYVLTAAG